MNEFQVRKFRPEVSLWKKQGGGGCREGANTNRIKVERNADDRAVTRSARARR